MKRGLCIILLACMLLTACAGKGAEQNGACAAQEHILKGGMCG